MQRLETLRFHEDNERVLCSRVGDDVQVQRHPRVPVRGERDAADHRNAKALSREEAFDDIELTNEVHVWRL